MTAAPTVTLATGEVVPSDSPQWRDECFERWERVVSMRPMSIDGRRAVLASVEALGGAEARRRLESDFSKDWQDLRGAPHASARR